MHKDPTMSEQEWLDIFAGNLVSLMEEKGYSQQQLADATGLSRVAISYYMNAKRIPSIRAIINLAYEFDLTIDELIDFGGRIE